MNGREYEYQLRMDMDETPPPRASRFREHTNTTSSIRPPPDELWKDLGIEMLIDQFNQDNSAPPVRRTQTTVRAIAAPATPRRHSDAPAPAEGPLGRFWAFFGSVLGKRKADRVDAEPEPNLEQEAMDARKLAAEQAYHEAKELGLLPAPKVFVRPAMAARARTQAVDTPARASSFTPRTPSSIVRTPSKKDLNKQKKLSKRVSSLEVKLASAKKELQTVLGNECFPAVPALPSNLAALSPTPNTPHVFPDYGSPASDSAPLPSHIAKKRRSTADPDTPTASTTTPSYTYSTHAPFSISRSNSLDIDADTDADKENPSASKSERTIRRVRSASSRHLKRTSSRLSRKLSRSSMAADDNDNDTAAAAAAATAVVTVVPGGAIPPVPPIPADVKARSAVAGVRAGDDGFGGLGHEIF